MTGEPVVETGAGRVRGRRQGRLAVFRGVPYAAAPTGAARFAPPGAVRPWAGIRDAGSLGPVAPQPAVSRLDRIMGPLRAGSEQGEDCLSVNVWTPGLDGPARPVLVWIHGGGFSTGAGSAEWYAGDRLAERGDLVVVTIGYRLGALGFLSLPGLAPGNMGLADTLAALRWVRDDIAAFGGDPGEVTVAGQSGGAQSITALLGSREARGLFRRAILQSTPLGMRPASGEDADRVARTFLRELDVPPERADRLREIPVERILAAQLGAVRQSLAADPNPLDVIPPFQLVADGGLVQPDLIDAALDADGGSTDLLIGWTRDELGAFLGGEERFEAMPRQAVVDALRDWHGEAAGRRYADREARMPGARPYDVAVSLATDHMFRDGALRLAAGHPAAGGRVHAFQFDWRPAGSPYGACHCIEMPFVFGDPPAWRDAPMLLGGGLPGPLVEDVQRAWISFVRSGDPGWQGYAGPDRHIRHIDRSEDIQ